MSLGPQDERTLNLRTTRTAAPNSTQGKQFAFTSKIPVLIIAYYRWKLDNYSPTGHRSQRPNRSNQFEIDSGSSYRLTCPLLKFGAPSLRAVS